jgi:hypothetical protein
MKATSFLAIVLAAILANSVWAHEGHEERVLGTITAVDADSVAVKTKAGKTVRIALDQKTVVLRGSEKVTPTDIVVGERAAVSVASRRDKHVATEIRLSAKAKEGR